MKNLFIEDWKKGDSIRVYSKLADSPLPFQPLLAPVLLFGVYYGLDGSLYTEHYAKVDTVLYERVDTGSTVVSNTSKQGQIYLLPRFLASLRLFDFNLTVWYRLA